MFSSQSSGKYKPNLRSHNRLELNETASSQGSVMLQRQESSSMSLGSQDLILSRNSQPSPIRKLYQIYTSKEKLFTKSAARDNDVTKCMQEPRDETGSIAVLNFLVKDLSEKCLALNENIEKQMQKALNDFLAEIEIHLDQKNLDQLDQFLNYEDNRIKIAELETIIHEKNEAIETLTAEIKKLRQERENVSFERFSEHVTSTLETTVAKNLKQANDEQVLRSKDFERKIRSMLNENLQEFKRILQSPKVKWNLTQSVEVTAPVPATNFRTPASARSRDIHISSRRQPKAPSLMKSPLEFVFKELAPSSRQSSSFCSSRSYDPKRRASLDCVTRSVATPLSELRKNVVVPSSNASCGAREKPVSVAPLGKRNWRRMSTASLASCEFTIAETSSEDMSVSSPDFIASKSDSLLEDEEMFTGGIRKMNIEKELTAKVRLKAFGSKMKEQDTENDILWA